MQCIFKDSEVLKCFSFISHLGYLPTNDLFPRTPIHFICSSTLSKPNVEPNREPQRRLCEHRRNLQLHCYAPNRCAEQNTYSFFLNLGNPFVPRFYAVCLILLSLVHLWQLHSIIHIFCYLFRVIFMTIGLFFSIYRPSWPIHHGLEISLAVGVASAISAMIRL